MCSRLLSIKPGLKFFISCKPIYIPMFFHILMSKVTILSVLAENRLSFDEFYRHEFLRVRGPRGQGYSWRTQILQLMQKWWLRGCWTCENFFCKIDFQVSKFIHFHVLRYDYRFSVLSRYNKIEWSGRRSFPTAYSYWYGLMVTSYFRPSTERLELLVDQSP